MTPGEIFDRAAAAAGRVKWFVHEMTVDDICVELHIANSNLSNWRTHMSTRHAIIRLDRRMSDDAADCGHFIDNQIARLTAPEPVTS